MDWKKSVLLLALLVAGVQCKQDSKSLPAATAGITTPFAFFTGTYELISYSRTTDFGQVLDENDFGSITGTLVLTPIAQKQVVIIDEEEIVVEGPYSYQPDSGIASLTGTMTFEVGGSTSSDDLTGEYSILGNELVLSLTGTTDLGVEYTETIRWQKISDFPQEL